jgi:hypothetical protein
MASTLNAVAGRRPRLREPIDKLESELQEVVQRIREKEQGNRAILSEQEEARRLRDLQTRRARVAGRVSLWLESAGTDVVQNDLNVV